MIPIVGPSYQLNARKADVQRTINMVLRKTESGTGKSANQFYLESIPGLTLFRAMGVEIRGAVNANGRVFVVSGSGLYEVTESSATLMGSLITSSGPVDMAYGLSQVVIVDGDNGYVFDTSTSNFGQITSTAFYGSTRVWFLDNYFLFIRPDTQQFYISAINDATSLDALDFASAESSPDNLVSMVVDHSEAWLFGSLTTEIWFDSGAADFPFERNRGAVLEVGCQAAYSAQKIDSSVFWLGQDANGGGMVYRAQGYIPQRISNYAVEQALKKSTDLSQARAYCYQDAGLTFYCLNAPGLDTTLVYEVSTNTWTDRAEHIDGVLAPHRALVHLYAFGLHLVGDAEGNLYSLDSNANTNNGDVLYRERTSPHFAMPSLNRIAYHTFELDASVGEASDGTDPQVELAMSDDGGKTWGNWASRPLGQTGQYKERIQWNRLGRCRDRVWKLRCTDAVAFNIIQADVNASEGIQ